MIDHLNNGAGWCNVEVHAIMICRWFDSIMEHKQSLLMPVLIVTHTNMILDVSVTMHRTYMEMLIV
jgi:hypothetical protein